MKFILLKIIILLILMELTFIYIIPACSAPNVEFDKDNNVIKFEKNRSGLYTGGSFTQIKAEWHTNNHGWLSNVNYSTQNARPRIAVIGDSYVEGFAVGKNSDIRSSLEKSLGGDFDVYSFGSSGFCLSQYLNVARYVEKTFNPDVYVFCVVSGDIESSEATGGSNDNQLKIKINNGSAVEEEITSYAPSKVKRLLKKSAIVRYFYFNKRLDKKIFRLDYRSKKASNNNDILADYIFKKIRENAGDKKVIILKDANRDYDFYNKETVYVDEDEKLLALNAHKYKFSYISLSEELRAIYSIDKKKFEHDSDGHWNEYGNRIISQIIAREINKLN